MVFFIFRKEFVRTQTTRCDKKHGEELIVKYYFFDVSICSKISPTQMLKNIKVGFQKFLFS